MTQITKIAYNNWPHCIELKNEKLKLIVTTDVGPRIIFCGTVDSDFNLFYQNKDQQGMINSKEWLIYGGHRLWHSPQIGFRPNQPDNESVSYTINDSRLILSSPVEIATKVQKEIIISMETGENRVRVLHRIYNRGLWPIKLSPWALTVMAEGGIEIFPIPRDDTWFMPNYAISFWPWTKPNDHRFTLGEKYMTIRHDKTDEHWFKIGYRNTEGWGAYLVKGYMFVKLYSLKPGEEYPDYGSTFETYTDNNFLELESLGPFKTLEPDAFTEHLEEWYVFKNIVPPSSENEIDEITKRINDIICR
jgi:hypothetical protein